MQLAVGGLTYHFSAYKVPKKGLLSIPFDGGGARRPQGQSFRESVGPNPQQKLDWLQVADELLQHPDSEIAVLLLKEIAATEPAVKSSG
jgi:hypothetical protein